jgi:hypothetical protein
MSRLTTHLDITGFVGFRLGFIVPFNIGISLPMMNLQEKERLTSFSEQDSLIYFLCWQMHMPVLPTREMCVNSPPQRMRCGESA